MQVSARAPPSRHSLKQLVVADLLFKKFVSLEDGDDKQQAASGNDTKLELSEFLQLVDGLAGKVAGEDENRKQIFFVKKVIPVLEKVLSEVQEEAAHTTRTPTAQLMELATVVANKAQITKIYDHYASSDVTNKFTFKALLAFAKAFEMSPGLYDMASLQKMFHTVNEGSNDKRIDTLSKARFLEFLDRSAQLFSSAAATAAGVATADLDSNVSFELLLAAMDNSAAKESLATARGGIVLQQFKCKTEGARELTKTVEKVLAATNKKTRDTRVSSVRAPVTNKSTAARKPVPPLKGLGMNKLAIPKKGGVTPRAATARTKKASPTPRAGNSVFDRLSTPRGGATTPREKPAPKQDSKKDGNDFVF